MKFAFRVLVFLCLQLLSFHVYAQTVDTVKTQLQRYMDDAKKRKEEEAKRKKEAELRQKEQQELLLNKDKKIETLSQELLKKKTDTVVVTVQLPPPAPDVEIMLPDREKGFIDTLAYYKRLMVSKTIVSGGSKGNSENYWTRMKELKIDPVRQRRYQRRSDKTVFGWHPYWMGEAYKNYNFSLLSVISYFSYELNPRTGDYNTIHQWETTSLVDSAKKYNTKVLLTVTNFGAVNNASFLGNMQAQANCIQKLKALLRLRKADGVDIDFEVIPKAYRKQFNNFVVDLSTSLRRENPRYIVSLCVPAVDIDSIYDARQLTPHVTNFVIMGYEFYGANSREAGPISPVGSGGYWWKYNLELAVKDYVASGIPVGKIIMGLPYYGVEWQTYDLKVPSATRRFVKYLTYSQIQNEHGPIFCCEDEVSMSRYFLYRIGNDYRQIWFEDSTSLAKKYDWVLSKNLGGVGIWALGYDNGYTQLWDLLAAKFTAQETESSAKISNKGLLMRSPMSLMAFFRNPKAILKRPASLITVIGAMLGLKLAAIVTLVRFGCRLRQNVNMGLRAGIFALLTTLIAFVMFARNWIDIRMLIMFFVGIVIAAIAFYIFVLTRMSDKEMP
ncbi:MAG: hypothetical protein EAZ57_05885 [Cytophagales bacterium]|nr:MAG: hypothetical protein EAZ67_06790 [Cytophagales bacterium]TAF60879.1 MAG: hypothetical protein EAZ57_05885 [Cytophagales bacterium]